MPPGKNQPVIILVLGILGLTVTFSGCLLCLVCGPIAWVMGNRYLKQCTAAGEAPNQAAVIGRLLGIGGTALLPVFLLVVVGMIFFPDTFEMLIGLKR